MQLGGAHVLVTGGSGVLGSRLAPRLVAAGARVTVVARPSDRLAAVALRSGATALPSDLCDPEQRRALIPTAEARHGPVDILLNNAGVETAQQVGDADADDVDRAVALNLAAPIHLCRAVLPGMVARRKGLVVNVSSMAGVVTVPGMAVYAATKAGLSQFTWGLRADLRGRSVDTLLAELGPITSDMMTRARRHDATDAAFGRLLAARLLTMLDPDDVADALVRAIRQGRRHLRLPRRAVPYSLVSHAPRSLGHLILTPRRRPS